MDPARRLADLNCWQRRVITDLAGIASDVESVLVTCDSFRKGNYVILRLMLPNGEVIYEVKLFENRHKKC